MRGPVLLGLISRPVLRCPCPVFPLHRLSCRDPNSSAASDLCFCTSAPASTLTSTALASSSALLLYFSSCFKFSFSCFCFNSSFCFIFCVNQFCFNVSFYLSSVSTSARMAQAARLDIMSIAALVTFALTLGARTTFCEGISCGPGWEAFSSSCYKKMLEPNGWLGARFHCVLEGGDLVSFNSSAEEDFVKGKIGARSFWIGLSNLECNQKLCPQVSGKELKWSDNTLLNHSNRAPAEAASTKLESCAYVPRDANKYHHPGKWRSASPPWRTCANARPTACQEGQPCNRTAGLALTPVQTSACDPGDFLRGHFCYRFENTEKTWQVAEDDCVAWGAHMQDHFHVGLKKNIKMFEWCDKTAMDPALWYLGFPTSNDCGALAWSGHFYDADCNTKRLFVCQKGVAVTHRHHQPHLVCAHLRSFSHPCCPAHSTSAAPRLE